MGPWEMRGPWTLTLNQDTSKADFSATLTMELSDYTRNSSNIDSTSATTGTNAAHSPHHDPGRHSHANPTGGFELSGPVTITKDGSPAPLAASTLSVSHHRRKERRVFQHHIAIPGWCTVHFGPQLIHGVVTSPTSSCSQATVPVLAAVTNSSYGTTLSGTGTILVWGQGFSPAGGNTLVFQRSGSQNVAFSETDGLYFWDFAAGQINASLGRLVASGSWTLTVQSPCSATPSNSLSVTIN